MKKKARDVMAVRKVDEPKTWEGFYKAFLNLLPKVSNSQNPTDIFRDVCRIFSLSIRGTVTMGKEKDQIEKQYQEFAMKYGADGMTRIAELLAYVVEALELRRSDFLGHVYEAINATVKSFGQFLTPDSVARFMARIVMPEKAQEPWKIVRLNDCSCGAGALLIEAAEAFINAGGRQGDFLLYGEDLDPTACCISYVQFSLLGYAAVITHQDSLSRQVYEGPWHTPCYFAHGMPMRLLAERYRQKTKHIEKDDMIEVRKLVQGEFNF